MNPEAASFSPALLALVPAPLVLAAIPVARKQRRKKKTKPAADATTRDGRRTKQAAAAPTREGRKAKPRAADAAHREGRSKPHAAAPRMDNKPGRRREKPPRRDETAPAPPVWPRAPPPARRRLPSPPSPSPAPLKVQTARPSDEACARWRVAADAWREDRDAATASDHALAKMRATAVARAGAAAHAAAAVARARLDDSSDDGISTTSSDTSVEALPPDATAAALAAHCLHGRVAALRLALRASRDAVNGRDRRGRTPLHAASACGHTGCLQALLSAGADVGARDRQLETPLHACVVGARGRGTVECVRALCKATGKVRSAIDAKSKRDGRTALHFAVERAAKKHGSCQVVRALVAGGASPHVPDANGRSALAAAAGGGRAALVRELLGGARRGAHCPDKLVVGPLQEAARAGDAEVLVELCAARLFDIDARETDGERDTALTAAARRASAACVKVLLAHGADPLREDGRRRSPVAASVDGASADGSKTLELLVAAAKSRDANRRGPDFFSRPLCGAVPRPPLTHVLRRGEVSLAATLIDCGAPGPQVLRDIGKLPDDILRHVALFLPDEGAARHLAVGLRRRDPPQPRFFSWSSSRGGPASLA